MQLLRRYRERKLVSTTEVTTRKGKELTKKNLHHQNSMATSLPFTPMLRDPATPYMSNESMRIASYKYNGIWDFSKMAATPEQLAKAGFYYMGYSDRVQCYYCNGALESWDYNDDPWVEHAKWYPCCEYMLCKKGTEFIAGVVSQFPDLNRPDPKKVRNAPPEAFLSTRTTNILPHQQTFSSGFGVIDPQQKQRTRDLCIKRSLENSVPVKQALELGIEEFKIKEAVKRQYQINDRDFASLNDLLDALDSMEENIPPVSTTKFTKVGVTAESEKSENTTNSERECKICYDCEADIVFVPCGHLSTCEKCASRIQICPICRSYVRQKIKTYTS